MKLKLLSISFCLLLTSIAHAAGNSAPQVEGCAPVDSATAPRTVITNGLVSAVLLLPDAEHGFYRGTRFDWSGVVWCLVYKGHNYFGLWNPNSDPTGRNRITGPVEEFRSADGLSAPGYDAAKPGDPFVKPGVGVLRRVDDKPYRFNGVYPVVDAGKWTVRSRNDQVVYRHDLTSPLGIAYRYEKTLKLLANAPVLVIDHEMKNTGTQPIDIQVYNHDFFVLDGATTGPDITLRFPFTPVMDKPMQNGARIDGNSIVFDRPFARGEGAQGEITGFSDKASDFHFIVENTRTGAGVEQTGDLPMSRLVFWSNPMTVCPEAYARVTIPPGKTGRWSIRYRFYSSR